jgi:hypothetical protein
MKQKPLSGAPECELHNLPSGNKLFPFWVDFEATKEVIIVHGNMYSSVEQKPNLHVAA